MARPGRKSKPHEGLAKVGVIKLVRRHQAALESFGKVGFQIRPRSKGAHGGGDVEFALLNEHQAALIISFMPNFAAASLRINK
jgi:hypothetical protein